MDPQHVAKWVQARLDPGRMEHSQRVARLATRLARAHDADEKRAYLAGVLHDCARDMLPSELHESAKSWHIPITTFEERASILLHAPVGAELVSRELGIADPHILDAIRYHTTGRSGMSRLEKILFVADYAEPRRDHPGVERVRSVMFDDLDAALRLALDQTLSYLLRFGHLLHPDTVAARNSLYM